tara:strand:- start:9361 stop:10542 length:1182 start_codon:yes stop_codon:yes gene_type:complete
MINTSYSTRLIFNALEKTHSGSVKIRIEGQREEVFGEGPVVAEVFVKSPKIFRDIALGGDIALAEAIIAGNLKISDEPAFIEWACRNDENLKRAIHGTFMGTLFSRIKSFLRPNTIEGAKKNIMAHYDLGNKFYQSWLDPSMSYSSALFYNPEFKEDFTQAQMNKYDRIIDELEIKPGDHVLEIGCGWGGFFSRAIERTGCKVTAVMNSPAQASFNRELIARKHLENHVNLKQIDYREISGTYDKVVSIEMIEAVGYQFWPTYFSKVSESLKTKGKALIQSITIKEDRFDEYRKNPDFINTYIFPGGMLLTNEAVRSNAEARDLMGATPFEFGLSYAETLKRWRDRFRNSFKNQLLPEFDEKFFRLWHFYLSYCEGAFNANRINVAHFSLEKK